VVTDQPITEELAGPRPPRRSAQVLVALVGVALAGLAVVRFAGGTSRDRSPLAAGTTTPAASSPVPAPPSEGRPVRIPHFHEPPPCPRAADGRVACTTQHALPHPLLHLMREIFPGIRVDSATTQILRASGRQPAPQMWSRMLTAHNAAVRIRLSMARREPGRLQTSIIVQGPRKTPFSVVLAQLVRGPYLVQVEARSSARTQPPMNRVFLLAVDRRLLRPLLARSGTMAR
jgi:hypothetical protein